MNRLTMLIAPALVIAVVLGVAAAQQGELPPGHPPTQPALPPGHPPTDEQPSRPLPESGPVPDADPADVESVDAIIGAYYASISGPAGQPREWDRFRSLFLPDARFLTLRGEGAQAGVFTISAAEYVVMNQQYFERGGYFESELNRRANEYSRIAQVFSTYASRRRADDPAPYSRGINSFQLVKLGSRWWIASMTWDHERPAVNPLPAEYLPPE
ncbi:MAG: hypothetical protein ACYTGG_07515 [Planctomycetota bacterium]|jgi:hypothetical protein